MIFYVRYRRRRDNGKMSRWTPWEPTSAESVPAPISHCAYQRMRLTQQDGNQIEYSRQRMF